VLFIARITARIIARTTIAGIHDGMLRANLHRAISSSRALSLWVTTR